MKAIRKPKPLKLSPIKSSWLTAGHYNAKSKTLTVEMKSGKYELSGVPKEMADKFAATWGEGESSGKFYSEHLRKYPAKKI